MAHVHDNVELRKYMLEGKFIVDFGIFRGLVDNKKNIGKNIGKILPDISFKESSGTPALFCGDNTAKSAILA